MSIIQYKLELLIRLYFSFIENLVSKTKSKRFMEQGLLKIGTSFDLTDLHYYRIRLKQTI